MSDFSPLGPSARAFSHVGYRFFWLAVMTTSFAAQIMSVAVAWQVYDMTRNPLHLGLIGLVQFLPALMLVLVTGLVADKFNRRMILMICLSIEFACALALLWFAMTHQTDIRLVFAILFTLGVSRAFMRPAEASLAPNIVPAEALPNAVAMTGSAWQTANIVGPMVAGLLYGIAAGVAYGTAVVLVLVSVISISFVPKPTQKTSGQVTSLETVLAGFKYVIRQKVVLGAIALDLFAVLLGGAVALLPVYARDILDAGPLGLGLLRAAPGIGAILVAIAITRFPIRDHAGKLLLMFVALFGAATVVFGFSTSLWVAVPALFIVGGADMVSVVIRETILQLWTPDEVRGRVNAVNSVFIGASNELGEFRAGVMAFWTGAVVAVTVGGAATVGVAALWAVLFPGLRNVRSLEKPEV